MKSVSSQHCRQAVATMDGTIKTLMKEPRAPTSNRLDTTSHTGAAFLAAALVAIDTLLPMGVQAEELPRVPACRARTACVSTSSFQSPSQYLPPWETGVSPAAAEQRITEEITSQGGRFIQRLVGDDGSVYLKVLLPYKLAGVPELDRLDIVIRDGIVLYSSQNNDGSNDLSPPFCFIPGCISGPRQRVRLEALRDKLGFLSMETDEDKKWLQIMLHD